MCECLLCKIKLLEDRATEARKKPRPDVDELKRQVDGWEALLREFDAHIAVDGEAFRLTNQLRLQIIIRIEDLRATLDYFVAEREANKNVFAA